MIKTCLEREKKCDSARLRFMMTLATRKTCAHRIDLSEHLFKQDSDKSMRRRAFDATCLVNATIGGSGTHLLEFHAATCCST